MPLIAVTGGIASGKSTVAARLAALGGVVVDADRLAREAVAPGEPALDAIRREFGAAVFADDGSLDRAALGRIVFEDEDRRRVLNGIVHPSVVHRSKEAFAAAFRRDPAATVVYDVPLIDERGTAEFDRVVVVEAPRETRVARLVEQRDLSEADARSRIAAQLTDEERRAFATDVIDAGGTMAQTLAAADALWERIRA